MIQVENLEKKLKFTFGKKAPEFQFITQLRKVAKAKTNLRELGGLDSNIFVTRNGQIGHFYGFNFGLSYDDFSNTMEIELIEFKDREGLNRDYIELEAIKTLNSTCKMYEGPLRYKITRI